MEGLGRWMRDAPPTHFALKVESFATLSASSMEKYESPEFEAADAKWKLVIYPNGNKARGGKDHISVYIALADKSCLTLKKEILVTFRIFIFDHIRDKYLTVEGETRFDSMKSEYGFDKFLPLRVFNDATNGYLIKDTCLFGAEVSLVQPTNKLKCLSMIAAKSDPFSYTWKVDQFSNMDDKSYSSEKFTVRGYDWQLLLYPKGDGIGKGTSISLFLSLVDPPAEKQVLAEYKFRLVDQLNNNHWERIVIVSFDPSNPDWGFAQFFSFTDLKNKSNGYVVNDSLIIEADVVVLGSTTNCV